MAIQESGEMYLETILQISKEKPVVRAIDICDRMGFSKPSVSRAVGILKSQGFIDVNESNHLTLTEIGRETAEKILERHEMLTKMFEAIGVDHETAQEDACRIEHVISDTTFEAIKKHIGTIGKHTGV